MTNAIRRKYLNDLAIELRARGLRSGRIVEEAAAHLDDVVQGMMREGRTTQDDAERAAQERFGSPVAVATRFASQHFGLDAMAVLTASLLFGFAISWMDNRPNWDDTGVTAFALLLTGGAMGLLVPRRPWLWAIAIWLWLPAWNIAKAGAIQPAMIFWLIVLAFPMAGALAGTFVRRRRARPSKKRRRVSFSQKRPPTSFFKAVDFGVGRSTYG
jgi:hypothetical protein